MTIDGNFSKFKYADVIQKDIAYCLAVAETLNVSKASELLGIQQSGLSKAIQRLEQNIGQRLFQRKNNGLVLTATGQIFFQTVKNTKQLWENSFNRILLDSESPTGIIRIGFHASFGQNFFPAISQGLSNSFPKLEFEVRTSNSFSVTRKVLDGEIDFGLVISKIKNPEIIQKKIGEDYLATYQFNLKASPTHLLMNPETQMSASILKKYTQLRKFSIEDYEVIAKIALKNNYLALLPHSVAKNYSELKQVSGKYTKNDISLICHKEKLKLKTFKKIHDEILLSCRSV